MNLVPTAVLCLALFAPFAGAGPRSAADDLRDRMMFLIGRHPRITSATSVITLLNPRDDGHGLLYAADARPGEVTAARRVAHTLHDKYGYRVFLIQQYRGECVPAFDGLILDRDDTILANFVLKHWSGRERRTMAAPDHDLANHVGSHFRGHRWIERVFRDERVTPDNADEAIARHAARIELIAEMAATFGVGSERPAWIYFDAPDLDRAPAAFTDAAHLLTSRYARIDRAALVMKDTMMTMRPRQVGVEPLVSDVMVSSHDERRATEAPPLVRAYLTAERLRRANEPLLNSRRAEDAPGLLVTGRIGKRATDGLNRIAAVLNAQHGLVLHVVADDHGGSTPGPHGLVLDAQRRVVANFVHQGLTLVEDPAALRRAGERAADFRDLSPWIDYLANFTGIVRNDRLNPALKHRLDFVTRATLIFAVGTDRPTWVIAGDEDVTHASDALKAEAARLTTEPGGPAVVLLVTRSKLITAHAGGTHEQSIRCQSELTQVSAPIDHVAAAY